MGDQRLRAYRAYLTLVIGAGIGALIWGFSQHTRPGLLLALIGSAALVEAFPARLRTDVTASLFAVVMLTGMLLGGTPAAVATAVGALPSAARSPDRRLVRASFNVSQEALSALAAGAVYSAIAVRGPGIEGMVAPQSLAALIVAMLAFSIANHGLVSIVIALDVGEDLREVFRSGLLSVVLQVAYAAISLAAAVLVVEVGPQSLLLIVVPAIVARTGLLAFQQVDDAYERLVRSFAKTIEAKDVYTRGHSERVSYVSDLVAGHLRTSYEDRRLVRYAAMLHDVGKIGVPLCVINKPGPLDDDEFRVMEEHPIIGENILRDIDFLHPVLDVVRHHHERLDGRGYPDGLTAQDLSEAVRIVTAVDAFDAMTSTRAYRRSLSVDEALAELRRCSGTQFDPRVVEALEAVVKDIGWEPTLTWDGDMSNIPDIKYVPPLTERHDLPAGRGGISPEVAP